jgi:hypothetical protein
LSGLNLLEFFIWGVLQAQIQAAAHANLAALRASIDIEWATFDEN